MKKAEEWCHVTIVEQSKSGTQKRKCVYCEKVFMAMVGRIKGHLLGTPNAGVSECKSVPKPIEKMKKRDYLQLERNEH